MLFVNKVTLMGNMGADPEFRTFPSGDPFCTFNVCTTEKWKDRESGELKERSEWTRVQVRDRFDVDYLRKYAQKGTRVYVEGTLRTRKFQGKEGEEKSFTEVDALVVSLESRTRQSEASSQGATPSPKPKPPVQGVPSSRNAPAQAPADGNHFENDEALNQPIRF